MAITRPTNKVKFATNDTVTITTGNTATSDLILLDVTAIDASVTLKADNQGTPAAGDTVDFFVSLSSGDPDGADAGDEFASLDITHSRHLGQIDTDQADPGVITVPYPSSPIDGKIFVVNNGASSVIASAVIKEMRA